MQFSVKSGNPEKQRTACVVIPIFESRRLSGSAAQLDKASGGYISSLLRRGDITGKLEQTLLLPHFPQALADRVLLVGCGSERGLDDRAYRKAVTAMLIRLADCGATDAVSYLAELSVKGRDLAWRIQDAVQTVEATLYRFDQLKSQKDTPRRPLRKFTFAVPGRRELPVGERAISVGTAISKGISLTRDLGNLPGNICTPTYLAAEARKLGETYQKMQVTILDEAEIAELGMGALLSVARGSRQEPKFIIMEYQGADKDTRPIVLVGKGVTFDAGGISIKPAAAMDEMKYDMCGAASVLGTLTACAELDLPLRVIGLVPSSENLPDGNANKPGDIVTSLSGQTVEVLNTDAEGRLLLCDALTYAERYQPKAVVDIATLTGACIVALGNVTHGLLGNHGALVNDLLAAGRASGDRAWELPLWDEYQDLLKSNFADMANIGGRAAGTITAACFLSRFAEKFHWAHLDIAGTAWLSGEKKGATGRPVPLLSRFLLAKAGVK